MNKFLFSFLFLVALLVGCEKKVSNNKPKYQNKIVQNVYEKIRSYPGLVRIEVRNYVKNESNKYQFDIKEIKKIKVPLSDKAKNYLELNLFVNETDKNAPLVAQFMLFDVTTKNLVSEENLNLD